MVQRKAQTLRRVPVRVVVHFLLACILTYGGDRWLDARAESLGQASDPFTQSVFEIATLYHWLATSIPRKPAPRFTTLLTLGKDASPGVSLLNICAERKYIGSLLEKLSVVHPRVVVIDKYFGAETCAKGDPGTEALLRG